jgi:hypothetical protein
MDPSKTYVMFGWDRIKNIDGNDAMTGSAKLFCGFSSGNYVFSIENIPINWVNTTLLLNMGQGYYCILEAYSANGLPSGPSNEIYFVAGQ